mmetsp:Transcript_27826/g.80204  ORF Transcript_27826/g.80204 Transcript_27826/m.80204 type:complete len:319 (-) Transcript_27826:594-1550(-)
MYYGSRSIHWFSKVPAAGHLPLQTKKPWGLPAPHAGRGCPPEPLGHSAAQARPVLVPSAGPPEGPVGTLPGLSEGHVDEVVDGDHGDQDADGDVESEGAQQPLLVEGVEERVPRPPQRPRRASRQQQHGDQHGAAGSGQRQEMRVAQQARHLQAPGPGVARGRKYQQPRQEHAAGEVEDRLGRLRPPDERGPGVCAGGSCCVGLPARNSSVLTLVGATGAKLLTEGAKPVVEWNSASAVVALKVAVVQVVELVALVVVLEAGMRRCGGDQQVDTVPHEGEGRGLDIQGHQCTCKVEEVLHGVHAEAREGLHVGVPVVE